MKNMAGIHTLPALGVFAALVSCGGTPNLPGFADDGGGGNRSFGASSGSSGSNGASSGGGGASGGGGGSSGFMGTGNGSAPDASAACINGSTQNCCSGGTQTCSAAGELGIPTWGPCLNASGQTMSCAPKPCTPGGEQGARCMDAGVEASAPPPPMPAVCTDPLVSTEPKIIIGYQPAMGQTVGSTGQIKVWVNDENAPFIAPGEQVDNTTGKITMPGDRTAKAADGYLDEPALYVAPDTPTNGGTPHFPQLIKGSYNNMPYNGGTLNRGTFNGGATIDPPPGGPPPMGNPFGFFGGSYTAEFVWDVSALGLKPGTYTAVFSIHDGDQERAIGCVTIVITGG